MSGKYYTHFVLISIAILGAWGLQGYYLDVILPRQWRSNNRTELQLIFDADPMAAASFSSFITDIEDSTRWRVCITSGLRTPEHQAELKRQNPKNASAFKSKHVKGLAIDINIYRRVRLGYSSLVKKSSRQRWVSSGILKFATTHDLKWGGDFKNYYDPVHFEAR